MAKVMEIMEFSELFESYIQSGNINFLIGSGASVPAIGLAGDIENEINVFIEEGNDKEANLLALDFIEALEEQHDVLELGAENDATKKTLDNYVSFLLNIDQLLFERKNHLIPRQANIFTTNYDLFIEHATSQLPSLIINDGFDRSSSITDEYKFRPERYHDRTYRSGTVYSRQSEVPTVNLFKIHGSLNWQKCKTDISLRNKHENKLSAEKRVNEEHVKSALEDRVLILPNIRKFNTTLVDRTYYDLLRYFANSIEKENSVLISFGFSFADEHILELTKRSLRNPTSQLIVFCYDQADREGYLESFKAQRNVLIIIPSEGEKIEFGNFNSFLSSVSKRN